MPVPGWTVISKTILVLTPEPATISSSLYMSEHMCVSICDFDLCMAPRSRVWSDVSVCVLGSVCVGGG